MLHSKTKTPYVQAYNSGTREAKPGGFEVWGQLQLHGETCFKVNSQINKTARATQLPEHSPSMALNCHPVSGRLGHIRSHLDE